jgi:Flp pilus assembly protein TadG
MVSINAIRRLKSERGAELIEFALVFPLLLLIILGIVDFGFLFQRMEVVTNAAREGARVRVLPGYADVDAENRVTQYLVAGGLPTSGGQLAPIDVQETTITVTAGTPAVTVPGISVGVTYYHQMMFLSPMMSWFGGTAFTSIPLKGFAVMRDEDPPSGGS